MMEPEDLLDLDDQTGPDVCAQCGEPSYGDVERGFPFGSDFLLCWRCAIERGGEYNAELDSWTVSPEVADLITE